MGGVSASAARQCSLDRLSAQEWDVVVVGGGISGAGVAQQAARQGWSVLLIEQRDFAWGSSSRSSKLVHGGLRYLKQGDIRTTRDSVRERQRLLREAPELVQPQSFLFAHCAGRKPGRWLFQCALLVYDLIAGERHHHYVCRSEVSTLAPGLSPAGLRGALVFQDAKTDDARLVWRVLMQARSAGAVLLNYAAAGPLQRVDGRVRGLQVSDVCTGVQYAVRAKTVINATGAWADRLRTTQGAKPMLRPLRGSHLIVPFWRLPVAQSISLLHPQDGRPVFLYPWEGVTLIGTTDLDHHVDLDVEASITPAEVDYLLAAVNDQFPAAALCRADITACYAGVRPVLDDGQRAASKAPREHVVRDEAGLITLTGGKLTTFRLMAQDALALAARYVGQAFVRQAQPIFAPDPAVLSGWSARVRERLLARYGEQAATLARDATAAQLQTIAGTDTLWLELSLAAQHEAVVHLDDLLLRRTRLGLLLREGALEHLPRIKQACSAHLQWEPARWAQELARYRAIIAAHYSLPASAAEPGQRSGRAGADSALVSH